MQLWKVSQGCKEVKVPLVTKALLALLALREQTEIRDSKEIKGHQEKQHQALRDQKVTLVIPAQKGTLV